MGKNRNRHKSRRRPKSFKVGGLGSSLGDLYGDVFKKISQRIKQTENNGKKKTDQSTD